MSKVTSYSSMYLTKPQIRAMLIQANWHVSLMSRGTGKTNKIQATRSYQTAMNVPGGLSVFYNETYIGAQQRTVSDTLRGWRELGLRENIDYVKNQAPPKHFGFSSYQPLNYKNVITFKNGHNFILGSNDRPGLVNSLSITGGAFIDECRYINEPLMRQDLYPAIRGKNIWGENNPFVFSRTYTSDMPFITDDAQWLLDLEKRMNPDQIKLIVQAARIVERLQNEYIEYKRLADETPTINVQRMHVTRMLNIQDRMKKAIENANRIRMNYNGKRGSVYFDKASFLSNINILGFKYFEDNADPRNKLVTRTSFLNIEPEEVENKFYSQISGRHFVRGNFDYSTIDELGIPDNSGLAVKAKHILDYDPNRPIDVEFDFGDMCSCSISQTFGKEERYIASFEVLLPYGIENLVDIIHTFLEGHKHNIVNVYKDPSGNTMRDKTGRSYGPAALDRFRAHKWTVFDHTPPGTFNPLHDDKHLLINKILAETNPNFPIVRIIRDTNLQLEASINKAPRIVDIDKSGMKVIRKDKSSEKLLDIQDKPMNSTDHSDHFDIKLWHKYNHLLSRYGAW